MFSWHRTFNHDIGNWDVGNVRDFFYFLQDANAFDKDISRWDVSSATRMI